MYSSTTHKTTPQTESTKDECCTDLKCETGLRNNYFDGKRLTTDSFRVEQTYMLERRRLLNRAIHGWGVVYGYEINSAPSGESGSKSGRLKIGAGLALDNCGRELLQTGTQIEFDDLILLDEKGARVDAEKFSAAESSKRNKSKHPEKKCWLLSVHYAEQSTAPVTIQDPCHCEHDEWDHTCETVRYSLQSIPCDECCNDFECELNCDCATGPCCDEPERTKDDYRHREPRKPHKRGGCKCLCEHLTRLEIGKDCGPLCEIKEPCARVKVDLHNGVPLACIDVVRDDCDRLTLGVDFEACGPRRLVKRNDLLFDLIRGCDLTRITKVGWEPWHRKSDPIPFEDFADAFGPGGANDDEYVSRDFWVEFSRPVRRETIRRDCFVMTVITSERDDVWWETLRVPIVRVEADDTDLVDRAAIVVDGPWLRDTLRGSASLFQGKVTRVELEVRGDFIVDCNGQTVDANPHGLSPVPTGNGTPGGTFLSTFLVGPAPTPSRPAEYYSEDRTKGVS